MNRESILKIFQSAEKIILSDILELVEEYCLSKKKDTSKVTILLDTIAHNPAIIKFLLPTLLDYARLKYNINTLYDQQGRAIKYF